MLTLVTRTVRRHPLATFVVLAYALSWWPVLPFQGKLFPQGVFLAALIVLAVTEGRPGVGALVRRLGHWRVGFGWYGIALGLPFAVHVLTGILTVLLGAPVPTLAQLPDWSALALTVLLLLVVGGQWEEPGWRGYAQPRLEAGRSALAAALLLGVIGIGWHLPLMLTGLIPWSELLVIPALFIVWAWAYNSTGGSLLIAVLFHLSSNLAGALVPSLFVGSDAALGPWLFAGLWCAVALGVILLAGPAQLSANGQNRHQRE
jgi:membrane protease YdiL (CAAX protease family)